MIDIDNIFLRANLQQIQQFLLHGEENMDSEPKDYRQRIEEAWRSVEISMRKNIPDKSECEKTENIVHHYATAIQDVSMEIGLQCGAILEARLFMRAYP